MQKIVHLFNLHIPYPCYIRDVGLRWIICSIMCAGYINVSAQVFPDLEGEELYAATVNEFKPNFVETYSAARVLMYTEIYNEEDSVNTIYSGHKLYLPPFEDQPIQFIAKEGNVNGINTEHIYPRSKGAKEEYGNAFSDLHNLAPARWAVNQARSNFPFGEIDDPLTDRWYYKKDVVTNQSDLNPDMIDKYSEVVRYGGNNGTFEPRESVKGDIARSVFYFYTMYREEALLEDPDFFDDMKADLCSWHNQDAVDEKEMDRNLMKAMVQDGKSNPFIMDCTLVNRMYCPTYNIDACNNLTTALDDTFSKGEPLRPAIKIYPNPNNGIFTLDISSVSPGKYQVDIFLMSGQLLYSIREQLDYFNSINLWNARNGVHIIHLTNLDSGRKYSGTFEVVK